MTKIKKIKESLFEINAEEGKIDLNKIIKLLDKFNRKEKELKEKSDNKVEEEEENELKNKSINKMEKKNENE